MFNFTSILLLHIFKIKLNLIFQIHAIPGIYRYAIPVSLPEHYSQNGILPAHLLSPYHLFVVFLSHNNAKQSQIIPIK